MGLTGTCLTVVQVLRSKPSKIIYRCAKGICLGQPALSRCAKEIAEYWFEIETKKITGAACQRALICLTPLGGIAGASILAQMIDHPAAAIIAKTTSNCAGLVVSGPCYGVDRVLGPIEVILFGEAVPLISGNRLFLFGNPLDD